MIDKKSSYSNTIVIGGGPAGLMAAEHLVSQGFSVDVFDAKPAVLRKFLVAGKGGLNLSRDEDFGKFLSRYGNRAKELEPFLRAFGPTALRAWVQNLGFETFVGSSGKIFPRDMQAISLRRIWIQRLEQQGIRFHLNQRWRGWDQGKNLVFQSKFKNVISRSDAVILALGGASWPTTGSDGTWATTLQQQGVEISPFKPANCGFEIKWSDYFRDRFQGTPLKSIVIHFQPTTGEPVQRMGEFLITQYGVEGSLIYAFSAAIRDEILEFGQAIIHLDLAPDWSIEQLETRLSRPRGSRSISSHIEKSVGIHGVKTNLLWEYLPRAVFNDPKQLAAAIKSLAVPLVAPRPIEEVISTAGGVRFEDLDDHLMLKKLPGVFCAGEMLDWEAPTGGYLLTACFSTGLAAASGVVDWLKQKNS
ncbi:MAG: aminoacetone oxidase family FAD-binding enzyme [Chloroflexi bacterium HGW-Chloroflexi-3]|nr:MAG: aminoacetone oxidase family FAD-binding enzyme [Chloroflexi bacterium HGW-Chloroflexi-3]